MPPVRRLTAILAADVAGYSRLMGADEEGADEEGTHERLKAHLSELVTTPSQGADPRSAMAAPQGARS
jgi:class 3 adenylate cyclase